MVADGKELAGVKSQQPDAVFFLYGGVGAGRGKSKQQHQRKCCCRQPPGCPGGTVLHGEIILCLLFLRPHFSMKKW